MSVRFCVIDENQLGFLMGSVKSVIGSCKDNHNKMLLVAAMVPLRFNNKNKIILYFSQITIIGKITTFS